MKNFFHTMKQFKNILYLVGFLNLVSCDTSIYTQQSTIFNLPIEVSIYGVDKAKAERALTDFKTETVKINLLLDKNNNSELDRINNDMAQLKSVSISSNLKVILQNMAHIANQYPNNLTFTNGQLLDIWGFNSPIEVKKLPNPEQIQAFVHANHRQDNFLIDGNTLKANKNFKFDLDGYDKGYALDHLMNKLETNSIKHALININGNVTVIGEKGSRPWKVGIQHPRKPGPIATLELNNQESLINAVDYERYFTLNGKRYNHIMDPATGYPVQSVQSVSILGEKKDKSNAELGALARILFIAGAEKFSLLTKQYGIKNAMLIDADGKVYITSSLARKIEFKLPKPIIQEE